MNNLQDLELMQSISKDEALELLFGNEETSRSELNCFDEFGNYAFPTDLTADTPNTAVGTFSGLSFIDEIRFK